MAKQRRQYAYMFTDGEAPAQDSRGNENKTVILTHASIRVGIGKPTTVWRREVGVNFMGGWEHYKTLEADGGGRTE